MCNLIFFLLQYGLTLLKQMCNQFLCDKVNTKTVANLLIFADVHSITELKTACVKYIRAHLDEVKLTKGWSLVEKFNFWSWSLARWEAQMEGACNDKFAPFLSFICQETFENINWLIHLATVYDFIYLIFWILTFACPLQ